MTRHFKLLLVLFVVAQSSSIKEENKCTCPERPSPVRETLQFAVKINSLKLVDRIRSSIAYASKEKDQLLLLARYSTLKELQKQFGPVIGQTNFNSLFVKFLENIRAIFVQEEDISASGIRYEVSTALNEVMTNILPEAFLCISLGKCRAVPEYYRKCMTQQAANWDIYFGSQPQRMAIALSETLYQYRRTEKMVLELHTLLLSVNSTISNSCIATAEKLFSCSCNRADISVCRKSCVDVLLPCFANLSQEWKSRVNNLMTAIKNYPEKAFVHTFVMMKKAFVDALQLLTERKSPAMAVAIFSACGKIPEGEYLPKEKISVSRPHPFASAFERSLRQLSKYQGLWDAVPTAMCAKAKPDDVPCWNGTHVTNTNSSVDIPVLKNVRPFKESVEGSGSAQPSWATDDEDFSVEGSGSGDQPSRIEVNSPRFEIDTPRRLDPSAIDESSVVIDDFSGPSPGSAPTISSVAAIFCIILFATL